MTSVQIRDTPNKQEEEEPQERGGRAWSEAAVSEGHQSLGEVSRGLFPDPLEGAGPATP